MLYTSALNTVSCIIMWHLALTFSCIITEHTANCYSSLLPTLTTLIPTLTVTLTGNITTNIPVYYKQVYIKIAQRGGEVCTRMCLGLFTV